MPSPSSPPCPQTIRIIGAGPAGIATAWALRDSAHDVSLYERDSEMGGLCRSFELAGHTFDYGGHAFFTKHDEILHLLESKSSVPMYSQPRNAWVYSHDKYIPYPFQSNMYGLPTAVIRESLAGLFARPQYHPKRRPTGLRETLIAQFGTGIADHFLIPYNEKLWAYPLDDISPSWTRSRIVMPDATEIIDGALRRRSFTDFPNSVVRYPSQGGFSDIYRPFMDEILTVFHRATVTSINLSSKIVTTADGRAMEYDHLVCTIPLPELVSITDDAPVWADTEAARLHHNSLILLSMVVVNTEPCAMHRIYCAEPWAPFHKLVLNDTSAPSLRHDKSLGIQAEISYSKHKQLGSEESIRTSTIEALARMKLIRNAGQVIATDTRHLQYAYPIQEEHTVDSVQRLTQFYSENDVTILGRFGQWAYINSDEAFRRGLAAGAQVASQC